MKDQDLPESKHFDLTLEDAATLQKVAHAIASTQRLDLLRALSKKSMNVNELAERLDLPVSTTALQVRILEEAGLIRCDLQPGIRGMMKLCHRRVDSLSVSLVPLDNTQETSISMEMNVGCFSTVEQIVPTCGLSGTHSMIGENDNSRAFYHQSRFDAQLLWFRHGFVTYKFGTLAFTKHMRLTWLELSFEACSEAPMYRDPWKSDISVDINGLRIGVWESPADFGGRRGRLNPKWWNALDSQFGMLKTFRVTDQGSYLDNCRVSDVTIDQLHLQENPCIDVTIGVDPQAEHVGGMNLFGKEFGDYPQGIVLRIGYCMIPESK